MAIEIEDLVGLNRTPVRDMPIVDSHATAQALWKQADGARLSVAGMHHSQGGHTVFAQGRVLLTETMNERITLDTTARTVTVDAGVTWAELHRVLFHANPKLCPRVHQSSPHFTVGGSISVNCHGRDPHAGPVATTVRSLSVLCGDGTVRTASRTENLDLFRAVVGGYGACGLILTATLDVVADQWLEQVSEPLGLEALSKKLLQLAAGGADAENVKLFYAWLRCPPPAPASVPDADVEDETFFFHALGVEYRPASASGPDLLEDHGWGISEMMRAAWSAARVDTGMRARIWQELMNEFTTHTAARPWPCKRRINWMRASVDFSSQRDALRSDILMEFFLPLDGDLEHRIRQLGALAARRRVNVLSATVRLVQPDSSTQGPYLSYCAGRPMVCVAMDVDIATGPDAKGVRVPDQRATHWANASIRYVLDQGGSYYLPYFGFADRAPFREAYGRHGASWQLQQEAIRKYNPEKRFWNSFLDKYLDPDKA
jgi:decaprenylphospho-beta-D-ribofuranose 2-oxidase